MKEKECMICGNNKATSQLYYDPMKIFFCCPICGRYEVSYENDDFSKFNKSHLASFLYYKGFDNQKRNKIEYRYYTTMSKQICDEYVAEFKDGNNTHGHPVYMESDTVENWYPKKFSEKIDSILLKLNDISEYIGQDFSLEREAFYSCMFVDRYIYINGNETRREEKELNNQAFYMCKYLIENNYISGSNALRGDVFGPISITLKGYDRIDQLQKNVSEGKQVLVAMKFGDDTIKLREAIRQGIKDAGYYAVLIDEVEHNDFITPELLKYIQNSKFVVVDLSHENNGAYFEEGYAMGLGKPVIQLCNRNTKLHFDIAQKNTILWDDEDEIPLRLKNRIVATID